MEKRRREREILAFLWTELTVWRGLKALGTYRDHRQQEHPNKQTKNNPLHLTQTHRQTDTHRAIPVLGMSSDLQALGYSLTDKHKLCVGFICLYCVCMFICVHPCVWVVKLGDLWSLYCELILRSATVQDYHCDYTFPSLPLLPLHRPHPLGISVPFGADLSTLLSPEHKQPITHNLITVSTNHTVPRYCLNQSHSSLLLSQPITCYLTTTNGNM